MIKKTKRCRTPTVENCLNCEKPDCNVVDACPMHISEILAEVNAGMLSMHAVKSYYTRKRNRESRKTKPKNGRDDY